MIASKFVKIDFLYFSFWFLLFFVFFSKFFVCRSSQFHIFVIVSLKQNWIFPIRSCFMIPCVLSLSRNNSWESCDESTIIFLSAHGFLFVMTSKFFVVFFISGLFLYLPEWNLTRFLVYLTVITVYSSNSSVDAGFYVLYISVIWTTPMYTIHIK